MEQNQPASSVDTSESIPQDATQPEVTLPPERKENDYLGHTLTPVGWMELRWRDGKEVEIDPLDADDAPIKPLHKKFRDKHRQALMAFMEAVIQVRTIDRKIPILREELMDKMKFEKQIIKDLVQFGLLHQQVIPISKGSQKMGGRLVITPTIEARKLQRAIEEAMKDVINQQESIQQETGNDGVEESPERSVEPEV